MTTPFEAAPPVVFRLPRWQPAVLFLVTAGLAAYLLYGSPDSGVVFAIVLLLAVAFFAAAIAAARMYLVADDDGVGVRRYAGETSLTWEQITGVAVSSVRGGAMTLQVQADDGTAIVVPPSLVLPMRPSSMPKTSAMLGDKAREIAARRPADKPAPRVAE